MSITLAKSRKIVSVALKKARDIGLTKPMTVVVLDARGTVKACESQDGSSTLRFKVAFGKANGCIALGIGARAIFARANEQPYFVQSVNALADGNLVPVPGGVLVRDRKGAIIGAVGVTGDTSDNDEICAVAAIEAAGLQADTGG
ncbi:MAG: heme-binding protein [Pseudomonadota bacterium]